MLWGVMALDSSGVGDIVRSIVELTSECLLGQMCFKLCPVCANGSLDTPASAVQRGLLF